MPSGPIIVLGEMRAVTSRPTTSKVWRVISQTDASASRTAGSGPNFCTTIFRAMPTLGPAPESFGVIARSSTCPSRHRWNVIAREPAPPTMAGISSNERTGLPSIARIASSVRSPASAAGCPASTWPTRTSG